MRGSIRTRAQRTANCLLRRCTLAALTPRPLCRVQAALRASGLPFVILRPGRLTDGPYTSYDLNTLLRATSSERRAVQLALDDTLNPAASSRLVVAEAALQALRSDVALGKAFDVGSSEGDGGPGEDTAAWDALFAAARAAA